MAGRGIGGVLVTFSPLVRKLTWDGGDLCYIPASAYTRICIWVSHLTGECPNCWAMRYSGAGSSQSRFTQERARPKFKSLLHILQREELNIGLPNPTQVP